MKLAIQYVPRSGGQKSTLQWMWEEIAKVVNGKANVPQSYEIATLPLATQVDFGTIVYVSDEAAGSQVKFSDGTNWIDLG